MSSTVHLSIDLLTLFNNYDDRSNCDLLSLIRATATLSISIHSLYSEDVLQLSGWIGIELFEELS